MLLAAVLLAACSARTPVVGDTPTQTASTGASPSPSSSTPAARIPVARTAVYADEEGLYLYDVNADAVKQVARGQGLRAPKFTSARPIAFVQDSGAASTLRVFDIATQQVSDLFTIATGIDGFSVSPDGQVVAYITTDKHDYPHLSFRFLVGEGGTQTVATLARARGRDIVPSDDIHLEWSAAGDAVLVVYTPADGEEGRAVEDDASQFQIRGIDGGSIFAVSHRHSPTMGRWSADGTQVYYRTDSGARVWTRATGKSAPLKNGVKWFDPWVSRDGRYIAYDTGVFDTAVSVEALNLRTGVRTAVTKKGFAHPVFATARTVWVQRVQPCAPDCPQAVSPAPEVYAVDVVNGTQKKLALRTLQGIDVLYA